MLIEINNTTKHKINKKLLRKATEVFYQKFKLKNSSVSVAIVTESAIKKLNRQYRHKDSVTDVLSFESDSAQYLGEVVLCYKQIECQAKELNHKIDEEFLFIFIHGLLHLLGYDDKTEAGWQNMEKIGHKLCKSVMADKS